MRRAFIAIAVLILEYFLVFGLLPSAGIGKEIMQMFGLIEPYTHFALFAAAIVGLVVALTMFSRSLTEVLINAFVIGFFAVGIVYIAGSIVGIGFWTAVRVGIACGLVSLMPMATIIICECCRKDKRSFHGTSS